MMKVYIKHNEETLHYDIIQEFTDLKLKIILDSHKNETIIKQVVGRHIENWSKSKFVPPQDITIDLTGLFTYPLVKYQGPKGNDEDTSPNEDWGI